ncbi:MAG TPA: hypothetical protein PLT63_11325, partial [Syntrophales bacterium]|nr:hypothetical protein [Syntrophales bacterium]
MGHFLTFYDVVFFNSVPFMHRRSLTSLVLLSNIKNKALGAPPMKKKEAIITFKVNEDLREVISNIPNRSE